MARVEQVKFNGIVFRRYPDAERWSDRNYYRPGISHAQCGVESLHREIWKAQHGAIPDGAHIHHRDGDTANNDISNLECVGRQEHLTERHVPVGGDVEHMERIRPLAAAWHRSAAGHDWHVEHAKHSLRPVEQEYVCEQCGAIYRSSKPADNRFCSNKCKSRWRRAQGVDDVERVCPACGATFRTNRYRGSACCSRVCAWVIRRRNAAGL